MKFLKKYSVAIFVLKVLNLSATKLYRCEIFVALRAI